MGLIAFLAFAALGGAGVVGLRERPKPAAALGLLATAACLVAALAIPQAATIGVGSAALEANSYVRLFLIAAALALLVSQVVGLAHGWQRELPLATLGALGLIGIALTVTTPAAAMLTVAAAGTFVVIASLERAISMPAVRAAASGFRLAVVAGFMGLVAMAITGDDPIFVSPDVLAGATLLMAAAVGIRVGAVPVHAPVARLIERAKAAALPLLAAWVPAAFAVVALGWTASIVALGATTPIILVVVAFGVLTIGLASTVVLIDDDLVRWLGYGVIADGGFILLAMAGDSPVAISAGFAWLVLFALARSIMACVLLGFQGAFDARRTRELEGWLRRTPLLGLGLLAALVVAFGVPGTLTWQVRLDLAQGALGEQLGLALVAVALLPLVPMAQLAWNGIRPQGAVVAAGGSERFAMPPREDSGDVPASATEPPVVAGAAASALGTSALSGTAASPTAERVAGPAIDGEAGPPSATPQLALAGATAGAEADLRFGSSSESDSLWARAEPPSPGSLSPGDAAPAVVAAGEEVSPIAADTSHERPGDTPEQAGVPAPADTSGSAPAATDADQPATVDATTSQPAATPTLSSRGRAARAARKASQPTIVVAAGSDAPPSSGPDVQPAATTERGGDAAETEAAVPAAPAAASPSAPSSTARLAGAFGGLRRAGGSASASAGPVRHALRRLPGIWALDRTLIASLATLLLAIVALAFATDVVGLGTAAGFSAAGSPTP